MPPRLRPSVGPGDGSVFAGACQATISRSQGPAIRGPGARLSRAVDTAQADNVALTMALSDHVFLARAQAPKESLSSSDDASVSSEQLQI